MATDRYRHASERCPTCRASVNAPRSGPVADVLARADATAARFDAYLSEAEQRATERAADARTCWEGER